MGKKFRSFFYTWVPRETEFIGRHGLDLEKLGGTSSVLNNEVPPGGFGGSLCDLESSDWNSKVLAKRSNIARPTFKFASQRKFDLFATSKTLVPFNLEQRSHC